MAKKVIRVAIIGTAKRSDYLYGPLLKAMSDQVELVSVWGRSEESAKQLGESLGVPWFTDLEKLVRETQPEIGIVEQRWSDYLLSGISRASSQDRRLGGNTGALDRARCRQGRDHAPLGDLPA